MKVRLSLLSEKITSAFWIIPGLITIFLAGLFFILRKYDIDSNNPYIQEIFFLKAKPPAVRMLLSSIATSVMTVLGVMFSIIVVVIEQMSNQYTPRVVSNFTRSTMAQFVLGVYVGTFAYCLILLMNVGSESLVENPIPRLAVAFAGALAILCLVCLIFYIHHITKSIQSTEIIKNIAREAIHSLRNVVKDREDCHRDSAVRTKGFASSVIVHSSHIGYIDSIAWEKLSEKLKINAWEVHFHKNAGDFVQKDMELLTIWSDTPIPDESLQDVEEIFDISSSRTISQDPTYGIQKLSDIALKALSPGINDPSTAIEAIHSITAVILEFIVNYPIRNRIHLDQSKVIIFLPFEPEVLIHNGYDAILRFSENHDTVRQLIKQDLRFIQTKIYKHEIKKHIEWKIQSITPLQ